MAALAATGFSQATIPEGYRAVYITSMQDTKFVIVPKARTTGNTLVVLVSPPPMIEETTNQEISPHAAKQAPRNPIRYGGSRMGTARSSWQTPRSAWMQALRVRTRHPNWKIHKADNDGIGNWKDMGAVSIKACNTTEVAQQWNVMADGRIALVASSPRKEQR